MSPEDMVAQCQVFDKTALQPLLDQLIEKGKRRRGPPLGEPPKVQLTDEDKKIKFRTTATKDLAETVFNTAFKNFSMPTKDEGFDAIRYEWNKEAECETYVKQFILAKKQTTRVEDIKPSQWFSAKKQQWEKAVKEFKGELTKFQQGIQKKEQAKRAKIAEKAKKVAMAKAAALKKEHDKKKKEEAKKKAEAEGKTIEIEEEKEDEPMPVVEEEEEEEEEEDSSANAQAMANAMARGDVAHGPEKPVTDGFEATVCVDPSLLPKKEGEEEEDPDQKRERSRSRERRRQEQVDAMKARVEARAKEGKRSGWVVSGPDPSAAGGAAAPPKEPEESREELLKMSVGELKKMLVKFGKTGRGCLEKKDFVDRLKPPKS